MEQNLIKMEELLGKKYEEWDQDTMIDILSSEELISYFTPETVVYLLLEKKNDEMSKMLLPVKFGFDVRAILYKIEELLVEFKEKNGTMEAYQEGINKLGEVENPIFKVSIFLTKALTFSDDYDLSKEEPQIRESLKELKELLGTLEIEEGYQVILEILDLAYRLREVYFQRYQIDLLEGDNDFNTLLEALNEISKQMISAYEEATKDDLPEEDVE